ncbi:MAG: hypothetical protein H8E38_06800 [SAR324 cluster bacterium]|nr:hypothetical protein [SAR324 cluster bacterium]MBL7035370.1 hypothetical protein [SAR324 cluster bacterium]
MAASFLSGNIHTDSVGNTCLQTDTNLSRTWKQAENNFEQAKILPEYFGQDFCSLYSTLKSSEQSRFLNKIAPLEYDWYLKAV